ncbi:MAG: IclR family transcriptional regulator [Streptosporangiales bacterium]|nr:IclR family transcriptional regulator [Streptosporangiales bacterium]
MAKAGADSGRRALEMLFAFTEQRPVASVRELAAALDIPVPSVHRYVALLRDMGLIEEGARGQYHLTMRVSALNRAARVATPLVSIADPYMRELSGEIEETVMLVRLVQGLPVCMHRVETPRRIRLSFEIGQHLPPLRGASARLLLGGLAPAERQRYLDRALESGARPPEVGTEGFLDLVEQDVRRGWAISNQEIDEGVWAASAAITEGSEIVATLSVPCPAFRMSEERGKIVIEQAMTTAGRISAALGG